MRKISLMRMAAVGSIVAALMATASVAMADVPQTLTHQGRLYDSNGDPVSGLVSIVFSFTDAETGGNVVWTETHDITFDDGYYSVELGSSTPFDATLDASALWVEISIGDDPPMSPRGRVRSVRWHRFRFCWLLFRLNFGWIRQFQKFATRSKPSQEECRSRC